MQQYGLNPKAYRAVCTSTYKKTSIFTVTKKVPNLSSRDTM